MSAPIFLPMPAWANRARCAETNPEDFFPEQGSSGKHAKRICASCDVAAECLTYALDNREPHGVWGGMTAEERTRYLRKKKAA